MMAITAEFQTGIAHLVGRERAVVEVDAPATVENFLRALAAINPQIGGALIEEDGNLELSLLIAIDDEVIPRSRWAEHTVADGSSVEVHVAYIGG